MSPPEIAFSMLENAIDSIERVVELLAWNDELNEGSRLKQAIMLTAHATELLLKERLRRVHPSLVWEDVDKYPRLDARTVGVDKALHRLKNVGGLSLPDDDANIVRSLRNTRNAIEHFSWETRRTEADTIIGQGLSFAVDFAKSHLATDIAYRFRDDDTWDQLLERHRHFASAHGGRVESELSASRVPVDECSFCHALTRDLRTGACSLCGHWESVDEFGDIPF